MDPSEILEEAQLLYDYFLYLKKKNPLVSKQNFNLFNSSYLNAMLIVYFGNSLIEKAWRTVPRQVQCRSSLDQCLLPLPIKLLI